MEQSKIYAANYRSKFDHCVHKWHDLALKESLLTQCITEREYQHAVRYLLASVYPDWFGTYHAHCREVIGENRMLRSDAQQGMIGYPALCCIHHRFDVLCGATSPTANKRFCVSSTNTIVPTGCATSVRSSSSYWTVGTRRLLHDEQFARRVVQFLAACFGANDAILDTDAELAGDIDARLVGEDHANPQR